jgi:hydrogenase maturation protease|nr:hydrogenase maturation protease [Candidatus Krumholzibacteria bacterium]
MKIMAVGNSFYGDDGVGAAVLEQIRKADVFPGADLFDAHTDALSLLDHLSPGEANVIIDAAEMGLPPGEVAWFRPEDVKLKINSDHLSMHGFGLAETFAMAEQLGQMPEETLIVGVQPLRIEINTGLSDAVAAAVPRVISIIQAEVGSDDEKDHPGH